MKIHLNKFFLLLTSLILSSCWSYNTTNTYSDDFKIGYSSSKPIYLAIKNTEKNTLYMILERNINSDEFFIRLRWIYKDRKKQFIGQESILRFLIDNLEIITLKPIKPIRVVSYHIEPSKIEEEAIYKLSREDFKSIATAKSVTLELEGKNENKIASFNKVHTFKAIREFYKNS
jgi:hypothetical protein